MCNLRSELAEMLQKCGITDISFVVAAAEFMIANGVTIEKCNRDCATCFKTKVVNPAITEEVDRLKALNTAMVAALKNSGGCGNCKHCYAAWDEEPCDSCRQDPGFPAWEWNGIIRGCTK